MSAIKADTSRDDAQDVSISGVTKPEGTRAAALPSARAAGPHAIPAEPQHSPELAHMSLARLRTYRRTLLEEELRASYWRRLLQARRDLLRSGAEPGDRTALKDALTEPRSPAGRQSILTLHPEGGMPILPRLPELWATTFDTGDTATRAQLFSRLASAESVLSSYREALHRRLDRANGELVARYHQDPTACFIALPTTEALPRR